MDEDRQLTEKEIIRTEKVDKLTPYCTCLEPLKRSSYILGSMAPGVILGVIPSIVAIVISNPVVLLFGIVNILAAGADFMISLKLVLYKIEEGHDYVYIDHPTEAGLYIFEK